MTPDINQLRDGILQGSRWALSKAITLVESRHMDHRRYAEELLNSLQDVLKSVTSVRVGVTGIPGVGKSTFIESLGLLAAGKGNKVAVLAIDPSSPESRGSILADKTRMQQLAARPDVFIRPSPTGGFLGGVHCSTAEAVLLCEAAGYNCVFIETVGVGQNELLVRHVCDVLFLLMLGGSGDELQGIKRGIMEMADIFVIHKADGPQHDLACKAARDVANALHFSAEKKHGWKPPVLLCSSVTKSGIVEVWNTMNDFLHHIGTENILRQRERQRETLFRYVAGNFWMEWTEKNQVIHKMLQKSPVAFPVWELGEKIKAGFS